MEGKEVYLTGDLGLASLLYAKGVPYRGLQEVPNTWKKYMVFDMPSDDLILGWQAGNIDVNALVFWRASRTLKHELKVEE